MILPFFVWGGSYITLFVIMLNACFMFVLCVVAVRVFCCASSFYWVVHYIV